MMNGIQILRPGNRNLVIGGGINMFGGAAAASPADTLKTDLVSWWSLNETSGTRNDSHGTNHLADNNTVLFDAGKQGNAAKLVAGNNEYLSHADNADLSAGDIDFTFALWIRMETLSPRTLCKWDFGSGSREYLIEYSTGSSRMRWTVSSTGADSVAVSADQAGALSTATWYFVVCWHDAANNLIGIQINDGVADTAAHSGGVFAGSAPFALGTMYAGAPTLDVAKYDGLIDEVGFWKRILTTAEKTWLYNSSNGRAYTDLN